MPAITVIIPVYNGEKTIAKTIESVLSQTFCDFEILIVNDGSTDDTTDVIARYLKQDKRIRVIEKVNGGIASARNTGVEHALGDYIAFIDADDWMETTTLEELYNAITEQDAEVCVCDYRYVYEDGTGHDVINYSFSKKNVSDNKELLVKVMPQPWNKLMKKDIFKRISPCYPDGLVFEDLCFYACVFPEIKTMTKIDRALINYLQLDSSIMSSAKKIKKSIYDFGVILQRIADHYENKGLKKEYHVELEGLLARNSRELVDGIVKNQSPVSEKIHAIKSFMDVLNSLYPNWYKNSYYTETVLNTSLIYRVKRKIIDIFLSKGKYEFVFKYFLKGSY